MRTYKIASLIVTLTIIMALVAIPTLPLGAQDGASGEEIVHALGAALNAGDVDLAMTYIADNAAFGGEFLGTEYDFGVEEIRTSFEELVAIDFRIETEVVATHAEGQVIVTNTRTWNDMTIEMGVAPLEFSEVYFIKDGQIFGIVYASWKTTEDQLLAAMASPEE